MESHEVRPAAKVAALGDEHLLDQSITADDDAARDAQPYLVDLAVLARHGGEGAEGPRRPREPVQAAEEGQGSRAPQAPLGLLVLGGLIAQQVLEPAQQPPQEQEPEREDRRAAEEQRERGRGHVRGPAGVWCRALGPLALTSTPWPRSTSRTPGFRSPPRSASARRSAGPRPQSPGRAHPRASAGPTPRGACGARTALTTSYCAACPWGGRGWDAGPNTSPRSLPRGRGLHPAGAAPRAGLYGAGPPAASSHCPGPRARRSLLASSWCLFRWGPMLCSDRPYPLMRIGCLVLISTTAEGKEARE
jgi:hypothetical protein